ncbi:battenin CLN3 protein [Ceratobasidium sp. 414]|nr:battenin CLN3 protein [Ceratobasidium sp. 414]
MPRLDETAPDQPLLSTPDIPETNDKAARRLRLLLGGSFFVFGLMNNDLVPPSTPKGIIAFCNIAPALIAKVGWPYVLKGKIRYTRRLLSCCALSVSGMLIVAAFEALSARLLGIAFASFASGLGELTFLQLSTTYHPKSVAGHCVGYFASGTGAAGLAGAGLWWELRGLGVRFGVGMSAILPFSIPLTYLLILPPPDDYTSVVGSGVVWPNATSEYTALPLDDDESEGVRMAAAMAPLPGLTLADKWRLARPLLLKYMLPLSLPAALLPVPSVIQGFIMTFLAIEAATGFLSADQPESTTQGSVLPILMLLIAIEGICGGLA